MKKIKKKLEINKKTIAELNQISEVGQVLAGECTTCAASASCSNDPDYCEGNADLAAN